MNETELKAIREWRETQREVINEQTGEYLRVVDGVVLSCEYDHDAANRYIDALLAEVERLGREEVRHIRDRQASTEAITRLTGEVERLQKALARFSC